MKTATLTIGLLTLVMVLTSFTTPEKASVKLDNNTTAFIDHSGGQSSGGNKKVDYNGNTTIATATNEMVAIDKSGGQSSGGNKKVD
jgi:general stress protein YciG